MTLPVIDHLVPLDPGAQRFIIMLEGLELDLFLGIHAQERERPQRVIVSVQLVCDYPPVPLGDSIENVVDYDFLRKAVRGLAQARRFDLQESFCAAVVECCWQFAAVQAVWVQSTKLDIYPDASIGCRVLRLRPN